jgi:hypothetical protein
MIGIANPSPAPTAARQKPIGCLVLQRRYGQLPEVVAALRLPRGLSGRLNGREQQTHQDADDGDNDQQFDERKTASAPDVRGAPLWFDRHGNSAFLEYPCGIILPERR